VFSATQVPDICIIKNDSTHIDTLITFSYPLEDYFEKIGTRDLPGFKSCESNACTRGYQAVWLVENDSLFLLNIQGCNEYMSWCDEASLPNLHLMFGRQSKNNRVYADWVNGKYIFFEGDEIPYLKKQLFNAERILSFKNGKLKRTKRYLNVKPRKKSFGVEENTPEFLLSFIQQNINWKAIPKKDPSKWITDIEVLIKKNGYTQLSIKTTGSKSFKAAVEKELSRCLKNFRWFQYRQSGSRIEVSFVVKAQFDNEKQIITIIK
jgi:hypothetical protein